MNNLWLTISSKPVNIAANEKLPIVEASIDVSKLEESELLNLLKEAMKRIRKNEND